MLTYFVCCATVLENHLFLTQPYESPNFLSDLQKTCGDWILDRCIHGRMISETVGTQGME